MWSLCLSALKHTGACPLSSPHARLYETPSKQLAFVCTFVRTCVRVCISASDVFSHPKYFKSVIWKYTEHHRQALIWRASTQAFMQSFETCIVICAATAQDWFYNLTWNLLFFLSYPHLSGTSKVNMLPLFPSFLLHAISHCSALRNKTPSLSKPSLQTRLLSEINVIFHRVCFSVPQHLRHHLGTDTLQILNPLRSTQLLVSVCARWFSLMVHLLYNQ